MFITDNDYRVVIGENALKVVSQASQEVRDNAELEACEEISGYLRPKYDTEAVFSAEGESRNRLVVMYAADIALNHMIAAMPRRWAVRYARSATSEPSNGWRACRLAESSRICPSPPTGTARQQATCYCSVHRTDYDIIGEQMRAETKFILAMPSAANNQRI